MMSSDRITQVVTIRPQGSWAALDLGEIWAARELMYFLTWKELKVRYKQTAIGVLWVVIQPVLTTVIFAIVFKQVSNFSSPGLPYPLVVLTGLLLWLYLNNAVMFSSNSLVGASDLVTKIYFPRLMLPLAPVLAGLVDMAVGSLVLLVALLIFGVSLNLSIVAIPLFLFMTMVLAFAVGTITAALNVRFRDVKFALPFALQIWMFASPIFYPVDILSPRIKLALSFNPMTGIVSGFRSAIFGQPFDWPLIGTAAAMTVVIAVFSVLVFKRMESSFADYI